MCLSGLTPVSSLPEASALSSARPGSHPLALDLGAKVHSANQSLCVWCASTELQHVLTVDLMYPLSAPCARTYGVWES